MYKWVFFFLVVVPFFVCLFVWAVVVPVIMVDFATGFLIVLFFLGGCDGFSQLVEVVIC